MKFWDEMNEKTSQELLDDDVLMIGDSTDRDNPKHSRISEIFKFFKNKIDYIEVSKSSVDQDADGIISIAIEGTAIEGAKGISFFLLEDGKMPISCQIMPVYSNLVITSVKLLFGADSGLITGYIKKEF